MPFLPDPWFGICEQNLLLRRWQRVEASLTLSGIAYALHSLVGRAALALCGRLGMLRVGSDGLVPDGHALLGICCHGGRCQVAVVSEWKSDEKRR
jgi:hypothetical protein